MKTASRATRQLWLAVRPHLRALGRLMRRWPIASTIVTIALAVAVVPASRTWASRVLRLDGILWLERSDG